MKKILTLILAALLLLSVSACSDSGGNGSSATTKQHDATWATTGHQVEAATNGTSACADCHGADYFGGNSGIDCYECHFGPTGKYELSDVIEVVGIAPLEKRSDSAGNSVVTTPLPNVAVNSYVYLNAVTATADSSVTWSLSTKPGGSGASLDSANSAEVNFRPDKTGFYKADVTVVKADGTDTGSVVIYANKWIGAATCESCHQSNYTSWNSTGHAGINDKLLEEDFNGDRTYQESCYQCHTVGYNPADYADNNGYDDVVKDAGFTLDSLSDLSSFDEFKTTYPKLAALSNVQCESCHGPGAEHIGMSSLSEKVCGQCHDAGSANMKVFQWRLSGHGDYDAKAFTDHVGDNAQECARCHSGAGFVDYAAGVAEAQRRSTFQPVTCAVCHDPHSATNSHQLRTLSDVTLAGGTVISDGGAGKLCMNCHQSRRDSDSYATSNTNNSFGPHNSPQADVYSGNGAYDYGLDIAITATHAGRVTNSCVGCHMAKPSSSDFDLFSADDGAYVAGQHTFKMKYGEAENVNPCTSCHSGVTTFNFTADADYDGDGAIEGVQDEVKGLLDALAKKLPPLDSTDVDSTTTGFSDDQLKAAYNYLLFSRDGSYGAHNFGYTVYMLQTSYKNLTGSDIPGGTLYSP